MCKLKVAYDNNCKFILDIINKFNDIEIESYNYSHYKEKKKAIPLMVANGTKNMPLIVIYKKGKEFVIWSESNPDWEYQINKILSDD